MSRSDFGKMLFAERPLLESRLVPDNTVEHDGYNVCIECTWRKGEYLRTGNRSGVAHYILDKLKNYAVDLRWTEP